MKYRLKDKELQAKLEAIEPEFGEMLSGYFGNRSDKTCLALYLCNGIDMKKYVSTIPKRGMSGRLKIRL